MVLPTFYANSRSRNQIEEIHSREYGRMVWRTAFRARKSNKQVIHFPSLRVEVRLDVARRQQLSRP